MKTISKHTTITFDEIRKTFNGCLKTRDSVTQFGQQIPNPNKAEIPKDTIDILDVLESLYDLSDEAIDLTTYDMYDFAITKGIQYTEDGREEFFKGDIS